MNGLKHGSQSDRRVRVGEPVNLRIALVWLALSAILLLTGWTRISTGQFPDPDDAMRLVQVRDLLGGQSWFDLTQTRVNPPEGTAMHWSRLVDAPLALIIAALTPIAGSTIAETIAIVTVPLLTLGVVLLAIGRLAWRLFDVQIAGFACLAVGLLVPLIVQLQPMRIDHHGWQIACAAIALWAISSRNAQRGGAVAGLAMAVGASISIEVLPMTGAFGAVLALRWLTNRRDRWWLVTYMQTLAFGLAALFFITHGWNGLAQYCDVIAPAHLGFFLIAALGTGVMAALPIPRIGLVISFVLLGMASFAFFAISAPACVSAPFAELDPLVRDYWYINVLEGRPLWEQELADAVPSFLQLLAALAVTVFLASTSQDWLRRWWTEYAFLLLCAIVLALLVWRAAAFAAVLSAVPLGWLAFRLLKRLRAADGVLAQGAVAIAMILILMPATPIVVSKALWPAPTGDVDAHRADSVARSTCEIRDSAKLLAMLPDGTVFAPLDVGPSILLKSDHAVVATGHHRSQLAMRDVIAGFTASPAAAQQILRSHDADYVVLCADLAEIKLYADSAPGSLAAQLVEGDAPAWLEPVKTGGPDVFRVWKISR